MRDGWIDVFGFQTLLVRDAERICARVLTCLVLQDSFRESGLEVGNDGAGWSTDLYNSALVSALLLSNKAFWKL